MYIDRKQKCKSDALFDVPHKNIPMTARRIIKKFPEFAKEMDGAGEERCLSYFWKRNKETKVYEFLDMEAEEEIAEWWGVELYDEEKEKQKEKAKKRALTEDEIRQFKEELAYASKQVKAFLTNTTISSLESQQNSLSESSDSESE
jgi:hypothetical protein